MSSALPTAGRDPVKTCRNILGLTFGDGGHDAAAAIVCDGVLVAAAEEERFTHRKHDGGLPVHAVECCLRQAGIDITEVDEIAVPHLPFRSGRDSSMAEMDWYEARRLVAAKGLRRRALAHKAVLDLAVRAGLSRNMVMRPLIEAELDRLRRHLGDLPRVRFFGHHRSHASSVFFTSGFKSSAVLTLDGRGGPHATVAWGARGNSLKHLAAEPYTNSLGLFYNHVTAYLGLGEFGEGKAMGLAPYGDPSAFSGALRTILDSQAGRWYEYKRQPCPDIVGFAPRRDEDIMAGPFPDFAAAAQEALERSVERAIRWLLDREPPQLCLSGGVALNCTSNGRLRALFPEMPMRVFPAAGDAGLSVGAALLAAAGGGELQPTALDHAYWGPEFSDADCRSALDATPSVEFTQPADIATSASERLASGDIIGWFQGRMEMGPRALGNRSILADPRTTAVRDRVNVVKSRELWRPLSPVVLAERAADWFELKGESPFMLFAVAVRTERAALIPAVVHVDRSARVQTVRATQNPPLHRLLEEFERRTGVPILLNTSFNVAGQPIVCTPRDAIDTFLSSGLDALVLGDYMVVRAHRDEPARLS